MATHKFFVMIKPDGVERNLTGEIIARFEKRGIHILGIRMLKPTKEQFMKHYEEHRHTIFFNDLINFMLSGSVIAMIMEGDIQTARVIVGNTIPSQAEPGSIRGDLASSIRYNLVHCSDKVESADKEVEMWSKFIM